MPPIASTASLTRRSSVTGLDLTPQEQAAAATYQQPQHAFSRVHAENLAQALPRLANHPIPAQRFVPRNLRALDLLEQLTVQPVGQSVYDRLSSPPEQPDQENHARYPFTDGTGRADWGNVVSVTIHKPDQPSERVTTVITDSLYRELASRSRRATAREAAADRQAIRDRMERDSSPEA